ncbi:molybdopterin-guanine dinucleotide biosynthesis protein B [Neobacillus notoginsengisoli]|uniref:Molybdopterin-guanine dinucleotide biosynthesis protein B n=1 Tax=Neobacillus notoginsengisoli TaxID=1578198 RepID=A0A417YZT4_9BACI|nr:molybdopterin-guanine dinucleotide biosynthesis protein B [Neobacillus notoginsengisoli]RHW43198.1 molybdopterin-guanine dinucleotide biosynthesis protein B [Neobacillus notoginsengisoli]
MAVVRPFIFQIVGFQNSGKTTLSESLITIFKEAGLKVSSIKHHGHGGKPEVHEQKDSARHLSAGAEAVLVEGGGRLLIHSEKEEWTLEEQLAMLSAFYPDVILIEGHKNAAYPKIVLLRNEQDEILLQQLENILALAYWQNKPETSYPAFPITGSHTAPKLVELLKGHLS